ncbi:MAG: hypothetical protein AB8I69_21415 [Anaerolineae bacterium]|jgi:hypothetical protein
MKRILVSLSLLTAVLLAGCFRNDKMEGTVLCQGSTLLMIQTDSEIVVENVSESTVAIRVSWNECDPWGTGPPECRSYIDNRVRQGERVRQTIRDETSVQVWVWDSTRELVDSCDSPLVGD